MAKQSIEQIKQEVLDLDARFVSGDVKVDPTQMDEKELNIYAQTFVGLANPELQGDAFEEKVKLRL